MAYFYFLKEKKQTNLMHMSILTVFAHCVSVWYLQGPAEGLRSSRTRTSGGHEIPPGFWKRDMMYLVS